MPDHQIVWSLAWAIPFCGILASLALLPLIAPSLWHRRFGMILMGWTIAFVGLLFYKEGLSIGLHLTAEAMLHHYIPFMALITVLFTIGGGIHITMRGKASPLMNTGLLSLGAILANLIGTTGASMVLIRPLIAINRYRKYKTHVVIFFIFLVSDNGVVLTPLGDPPLFIGFLNGIDFFWTTTHLFIPFLVVGGIVLAIFWLIDHYYFYHDPAIPDPAHAKDLTKTKITGRRNLLFLTAAIMAILGESLITSKPHISLWDISINLSGLGRDIFLLAMAIASWKLTPPKIHRENKFTWEPLEEVALVFLGIFITVIPLLDMLKAGEAGPMSQLVHLVNPNGNPHSTLYFWLTGILSSFLDNAPTYLIFFEMAGGDPAVLMGQRADILIAISSAAVFMGAMTYIGNAPNFMVRSIATKSQIKMPGFLGYMVWSIVILLPVFILLNLVVL